MIIQNGCFYGAGGGEGSGGGPYESQTAGVLYNENYFSRHIYFLEKMYWNRWIDLFLQVLLTLCAMYTVLHTANTENRALYQVVA